MGELINLNPIAPIADADLPASITRDAEYVAALLDHINAFNPHSQYLFANPTAIEFGLDTFNSLDFHTGSSLRDFDVRLIGSGGGATNGLGQLLLQAALFNINSKIAINGGAQLSRLLSATTTVDLPPIAAGATFDVSLTIANAVIGDLAFFYPTQLPINISFFNIRAIINSAGTSLIRFQNLANSTLDIAAFTGRLIVLGF